MRKSAQQTNGLGTSRSSTIFRAWPNGKDPLRSISDIGAPIVAAVSEQVPDPARHRLRFAERHAAADRKRGSKGKRHVPLVEILVQRVQVTRGPHDAALDESSTQVLEALGELV